MPQIDLVTYGDTALTSFIVFWVYFIALVLLVSTASSVRYFPTFFQLSIVNPLARFMAHLS